MSEGNMIANVVNNIVENAIANNPQKDGDYIGKDGLLYCGNCHTPKQCRVKWIGDELRLMPTPCKCRKEEIERQNEEERRLNELRRIEKLKRSSLIDDKFLTCTFDNLVVTDENRRQVKICKRYAVKFAEMYKENQGLLLYGDVGTGKTHLACCIGNYLMEHLTSVYATSLVKVMRKCNSFRNYEDEEYFISRVNEARLLIIDDLGAERSTDYALEIVYNIIDSRYRAKKPMIVTTNLSLKQMQSCTDVRYSRIYDRILENCYPVLFTGKSLRKKEASRRFDKMKEMLESSNED